MERLTKTAQKQHNIHNFRRKKALLFDLFRSYSVLSSSKNETKAEGSFHWYKSTYSWEIDGETVETVADFIFWAPKSLQMVIAAMKLKDAYSLEGKLWPT